MPAIGGSIESVGIGGRIFPVAADVESNRKLGGWENEVLANGDGTARIIKTRVPLSLDGLALEIDDDRGDHEYLQEQADLKDYFVLDITYASGAVWQGSAQIVGEMQFSSKTSAASVSLMGPGTLTRQ